MKPIHHRHEVAATKDIHLTKALALTLLTHFGHTMNDHMAKGHTDLTSTARLVTMRRRTRLVFRGTPDVGELMQLREALPTTYYTQLPVPNDDSLLSQWVAQTQSSEVLARTH